LTRFVDDEGSALSLLLCDLLGFDRRSELGRERELLFELVRIGQQRHSAHELTVRETSSTMMLNLAALLTKLSLTIFETFSLCVISWLALNWATTLFSTSFTMLGRTRSS